MARETYHPAPGYADEELAIRMYRCLAQAEAMSLQTFGGGNLGELPEEHREAFMHALHDKIVEVRSTWDEMSRWGADSIPMRQASQVKVEGGAP